MVVGKHPHKNFYFDVDDTLIMWDYGEEDDELVEVKFHSLHRYFRPHKKHIADLKKFSDMGYTIIVWSQSGGDWAEHIVKALDLEEYVDICLGKPNVYYDDIPVGSFMPDCNRFYYDVEGNNTKVQVS